MATYWKNYYPVCVHGILATKAVVSALNPLYEPNVCAYGPSLYRLKNKKADIG